MKRLLCLMAACLLIPCAVLAASPADDAVAYASICLTEVYGYTAEDADAFTFEVEETAEGVTVTFFNHPGWEYTVVQAANGERSGTSPFRAPSDYPNYPGENSVRQGLYAARENGWFTRWDEAARAEMAEWLAQWGVTPTPALAEGLSSGALTPAQALNEYFLSCYGPESAWPQALTEWRDEELDSYGFVSEPVSQPSEGVRTYPLEDVQVTEFSGETPPELASALSNPNLSGWTPGSGAYVVRQGHESTGLTVFERGEERMLCSLWHGADGWFFLPVGDKALLPGREVTVRYGGGGAFELRYPISDAESEVFSVTPIALAASENHTLRYCRLNGYVYENADTGAFFQIDSKTGDAGVSCHWYRMTSRASAGQAATVSYTPVLLPLFLDFWDISAFPRTEAAFYEAEGDVLPDGLGVVTGVRLRRETSTRSDILGDYFSGVTVEVLEELPGDPYPWYHVRIGRTEGYMSGIYVAYPGSVCSMEPLQNESSLPPMATATVDTALKAGTGWFDKTLADLPAGTRLHVLAEQGDWLHVTVADGPMGWLALTDGLEDGYVKAADVRMAATEAQLDWME